MFDIAQKKWCKGTIHKVNGFNDVTVKYENYGDNRAEGSDPQVMQKVIL